MKKKYNLTDLDCANCVNNATVSFMAQKLTIDADDSRFDSIMKEVVNVCRKVEPDCVIEM